MLADWLSHINAIGPPSTIRKNIQGQIFSENLWKFTKILKKNQKNGQILEKNPEICHYLYGSVFRTRFFENFPLLIPLKFSDVEIWAELVKICENLGPDRVGRAPDRPRIEPELGI